jgi:hypothetical protein
VNIFQWFFYKHNQKICTLHCFNNGLILYSLFYNLLTFIPRLISSHGCIWFPVILLGISCFTHLLSHRPYSLAKAGWLSLFSIEGSWRPVLSLFPGLTMALSQTWQRRKLEDQRIEHLLWLLLASLRSPRMEYYNSMVFLRRASYGLVNSFEYSQKCV